MLCYSIKFIKIRNFLKEFQNYLYIVRTLNSKKATYLAFKTFQKSNLSDQKKSNLNNKYF